jgi:hypothetical protein
MTLLFPIIAYFGVVAHAGTGPKITVEDDGTVVARMMIDAPPAQVRQVIPDVQAGTSTNVLSSTRVPDGSCIKIDRRTRGLWDPLEMKTRLCPTDTGWRESLISSDDFNAYSTEWSVRDDNGQSSVQVRVRSEVNLLVPTSMVQSGTIQGLHDSFAAILRKLLAARNAP